MHATPALPRLHRDAEASSLAAAYFWTCSFFALLCFWLSLGSESHPYITNLKKKVTYGQIKISKLSDILVKKGLSSATANVQQALSRLAEACLDEPKLSLSRGALS
jgi:hypothetical protein